MTELKDLYILVAEDDVDDGKFIKESLLRHRSFTKVSWVKNGKELLDQLSREEKKPDVILTDINMPIVNGIEALEAIFRDAAFCSIPCFVYSSAGNPMYEKKCRELGVRSFLIKPFNLKDFALLPGKILAELSSTTEAGKTCT